MNFFMCIEILLIIFVFNNHLTESTISKKSKTKKSKKEKELSRYNVMSRELVQTDVLPVHIIDNEWKYCEKEKNQRNWDSGEVLAYVTPWNNHGYEIAKTFAKFTMLCPVWLQIKRKQRGFYNIEGLHDIDRDWMKAVKKINPGVKIVPRILFDGWSTKDYDSLFASEDEIESMIEKMVQVLTENKLDGAVIEVWSQVQGSKHEKLIHVLKHIGEQFHEKNLRFILVIPPGVNAEKKIMGFTKDHLQALAPFVDYFSLMAYDFHAVSGKAGANAPYDWIKACILVLDQEEKYRKQILTGLNFYGQMFTKEGNVPLIGNQYVSLLEKFLPDITWESTVREHYIDMEETSIIGRTLLFYPTLKSIHERLELLKEMGTGVSIWEIGQGLDYFYDLL